MPGLPTAKTAGDILTQVSAEVGIEPSADFYTATDPIYVQLRTLLNVAGQELAVMYEWESLQRQHAFTTQATDTGDYDLPADFDHMIPQTNWDRTNNLPVFGPLSPQGWQYLLGRDLVTSTIYASFRLQTGQFRLFPQPPPTGLEIVFEYQSQHWVEDGDSPGTFKTEASRMNDIVCYHHVLISRYLKVKHHIAKGLATGAVQNDFDFIYGQITAQDKSAPRLNAGTYYWRYPYLDTWRNTPDSGYGVP